jgi:16S rRNA (guanine966-N2)-methyltransferase
LNEVRIIGGKWKRRKLRFPDRPELRPTLDRVRETLFNWLAPYIADARCLDLFAGTGALGFEALSRGAAEVTLVEHDVRLVRVLQHHRELLGADACTVVRADALPWLERQRKPWDVVFVDPPFRSTLAQRSLDVLLARGLVTAEGLVYLERRAHAASTPSGWAVEKSASAGATTYQLLRPETRQ